MQQSPSEASNLGARDRAMAGLLSNVGEKDRPESGPDPTEGPPRALNCQSQNREHTFPFCPPGGTGRGVLGPSEPRFTFIAFCTQGSATYIGKEVH